MRKASLKTYLYEIIFILVYKFKYGKALKYLNKIKITRLTLPIIKFNLAKTYEEIGNFEKAKELYKEVAEKGNKLYMGKVAQEKILELS